jgi:murein DD-endopeptidase MepM/ murein hydrolase activator NlpD
MEILDRLRAAILTLFPERHLYVRCGGDIRGYVLTSRKQMIAAAGVAVATAWTAIGTASLLMGLVHGAPPPAQVAQSQVSQTQAAQSPAALANLVERRHAALALLLSDVKGAPGAVQALTPPIAQSLKTAAATPDPMAELKSVAAGQDQVLAAADRFAQNRAERLRKALKLAGVAPPRPGHGSGGTLVPARDTQAMAAVDGVDPGFARRIQEAAASVSTAQALSERAVQLPLARPTHDLAQSSGFGYRIDPFTRRAAFHPGLDFPGARMTPIYATAAGVVSFSGVRSGYGQTLELDHGQGIKTRYAHLARISVRQGQHVAAGALLGGMGSSGRSTGTHLHYEVWVNGRVQDPARFVRAGDMLPGAG